MNINVLVADKGWILERYAKELKKRLNYVTVGDSSNKRYDLTYFINYGIVKNTNSSYTAALFTHIEESLPANKQLFYETAKKVDICISLSQKYANILRKINKSTFVIPHGTDPKYYQPKLILGFVGRFYDYTDRKGKILLDALSKLDYVEIKYATGEIKNKDLPDKFYNGIDYTIITSKYEGGPMCLIESLAVGKEVIAPKDIGMVSEFHRGIYHYKNSDIVSLKKTIDRLYQRKLMLHRQVSHLTWDRFAAEHDKVFRKYIYK